MEGPIVVTGLIPESEFEALVSIEDLRLVVCEALKLKSFFPPLCQEIAQRTSLTTGQFRALDKCTATKAPQHRVNKWPPASPQSRAHRSVGGNAAHRVSQRPKQWISTLPLCNKSI